MIPRNDESGPRGKRVLGERFEGERVLLHRDLVRGVVTDEIAEDTIPIHGGDSIESDLP